MLKEGETSGFEAFVTKGLFKVYHTNQDAVEQILYFAMEGWWLADIDSFTHQHPSQLNIDAIEESEIFMISKNDKEYAYNHIPGIEKLFRVMTQRSYVALQRRMIENLSVQSDQRYLNFIKKYPLLAQRLTDVHSAAYLGISHEFVSRIRHKIIQKKLL
ncbi:Crp/Fnr family transcriptional regulator [uncultured Chryseobacterium sp.]|uniref:Crp/Fnr family transcriptional regulator n=1 Tax=uncultured Chryseobacterium sp. TaxID=259322 RepID=UPI0025D96345|nr:Crp/Fnr family transcriptional regulator [uncultured Chryseobacterium sp.]